DALEKAVNFLLPGERTGGIVWVRDEDQTRFRRDGGQDSVEIMPQIRTRHFDCARAEHRGDELVNDKGVLGSDDLVAVIEEGVAEKFDELVRACAENEVVPAKA